MGVLEDYLKEQKLAEIEANYIAAKELLVIGSKTYRITQENIMDIVGLATLNVGSDLGVMENDSLQLVQHTPQQIKDVLEAIRVHLTAIKTERFTKRETLNSLIDHALIVDFDTSIASN